MQRTTLPANYLNNILGYVQVLKQFRCDRRPESGYDQGAEPGGFTKALLAYASHSLESFSLTGATAHRSDDDEDIKGSLQGFQGLEGDQPPLECFPHVHIKRLLYIPTH